MKEGEFAKLYFLKFNELGTTYIKISLFLEI